MKFKKILVSICLFILIFFSFVQPVHANLFDDDDKSTIEKTIDEDEGGLFEKIIAKMIGGLAEAVFDLTTEEEYGVGFEKYDELIFAKNQSDLYPFTEDMWNLIMQWYWIIAGILGGPILIAIVVLAWKMIVAGISPDKRTEAKDNIMRLLFGAVAIVAAPFFVRLMLLLNNNLVKALVSSSHGSLDELLGDSVFENISTGNAIATAIVIAMFAYLFVKVNIKFIIRQFTLIVFTIFTPIVAVFWILNKRTIASSIWFGQIIINAFMQFVYTFLFLLYMTFLPESSGWAVSLLWAMMILPLADALQNTMQNLVSRIAGVNNEELANRGIGMGAAMGHTVRSIAYQFKSNSGQQQEGGNDIISRVMSRANSGNKAVSLPGTNQESHSTNIMDNAKNINQTTNLTNQNESTSTNMNANTSNQSNIYNHGKVSNINNTSNSIMNNEGNKVTNGIKKAYNVGKEFMNLGMYMAEGRNFKTNGQKEQERKYDRPNINNTRKEDNEPNEENQTKIIINDIEDDADG